MPTPRSLTAERLLAVEERLSSIEARYAASGALIAEIHTAVIGNGAAGSTLRERVQALETSHAHESSLKYRGTVTAATAVVSAALAFFAHALTVASQH